ncbi:hypothetical protein ZWY2020_043371 [Hordeum vulgare]|nr:hypothetical protein ZWY2020_043371 [Hordeum vulgare]
MRSSRLSRSDRALLPSLTTATSSGRSLLHCATTSGRSVPPRPRLLPITTDPSHLSDPVWMVAAAVAAVLASWVFNALLYLVWRPHAITRQLHTQGRTFLYWFGARPSLCVADVNVVKQVLPNRSGMYPKNIQNPHIARLLNKGMVLADGDDWKRHRKVVHPAFNKRSRRSTSSVFMAAVMANSAEKIRLAGNQNVMVCE